MGKARESVLMMVVSKYGFSDVSQIIVGNISEYRLDPSRIAAQIVSGVVFLGAGMTCILQQQGYGQLRVLEWQWDQECI